MREILVFCVVAILQATGNPFGYMALSDVNSCLLQLHQQLDNKLTTTTSGIVGVGFDDLTNEITLPIFATTFYKCKTTPDGHFLIPDNVLAVPIQEVFIDRSARSYKSYDDVEKERIKDNRHDINGFVGGGTFAKGNQETKKYFSDKNTMMFEVKIGYKAFIFIAEDTELDNAFRGKIDDIIESLDRNLTILAKYQAECIIRDYGTHIVNCGDPQKQTLCPFVFYRNIYS
uniref:Uncharacterized protein n=1 Tax=Panagrolaimus sp. PS1159 TaxID=55785 RepID=A0AC35ER06_9BILA